MEPKEFPGHNIKIAEHQEEFITLPAFYCKDTGTVTFCMELNEDEINRLKATNELWFQVLTGGQPLQPFKLSTNKEDLIEEI